MKSFKTSGLVRFRSRIQNTLLFYYLFPILVIFILLGAYFYLATERLLDQELGKRLNSVALFASYQIKPFHLSALRLNDPTNQTYTSLEERFSELKKKNDIARIFLFDPAEDRSLLDTDTNYSPGQIYERNFLHKVEIQRAMKGKLSPTFLFKNHDGQFMKSSFAPVYDGETLIAIVGVDGNATFFKSLHELEKKLIMSGLLCIATIIFVSLFLSKKIVNPIQELVYSARKIGDGDLDDAIKIKATNELGFLGFVMDEMRRKIVERDQELQVMLRGIAHEVRNPLGGIELFSGILSEEVKDTKSKQAVAKIQREVANLKVLVDEFLNFAKKPSLQISKFSFPEFMTEIQMYVSEPLKNGNVTLLVNSDLETIRGDEYHMERVFLNLINNSIQAMPDGGTVTVNAVKENGQYNITVEDTGHGISIEDAPKIFDPFYTTREYGNGLGLSFVQKIVQAHGGTISVESELNKGTKMIINLPG
ncbi:MAG: HAMP domain-containing histidine kinase [Proteobacteria bacterium]|nr:HAMP domain-containing histidine kinase [Pseudomonadota bacterium]